MSRRHLIPVAGWLLSLAVAGCSLAPPYVRPEPPVPSAFPQAGTAADAPQAVDVAWQDYFPDPNLRAVIDLALANNRDLRIATLNIDRAQALYRVQRAERFPSVSAGATVSSQRIPGEAARDGEAYTATQYTVALGVSGWELDLFGRVRSLQAAALEQYLATEQAAVATRLALVAAVAQAYLTHAADAENLHLAQATLETLQSSLTLIQKSRDLGLSSDLDFNQVRSQVETARANVARYTGLVAVDLNALQVVVGAPVSAALLAGNLGAVAPPRAIAAGLPSDVLLRRPDILAAEHRLRSANANIGAARAALFPRISLTMGVGISSSELSSLFGSGTGTWSFVPQITQPIFNSGALKARVRVTELDREMAVAGYEKGIQQAFAEVANALTLRQTLVSQRQAQEALVQALEETFRLYEARYRAGLDGYLGVLVAQQALFSAQQALVGVRLAERTNLVTLYKVLGGGV